MSEGHAVPAMSETDVLVVGGGGAGFRAAIAARERGARALLVSKGSLARSGASPMAGADVTLDGQGMRSAGYFGEPHDSQDKFLGDIVTQGCYLNNQKLASLYVECAPDRLKELLAWGIRPFFADERAVFTTGTGIMDALQRQAKRCGVEMVEDVAVLDLLLAGGQIAGALALDLATGQFVTIRCRAAVLASGGWHKAYTPVTGSRELTGDGVAMALRAGAALANMEFVTFCCNVLLSPPAWRGSIFTYVIGLLVGGKLLNAAGESILDRYDPQMVRTAVKTEWNKSFLSHVTSLAVRAGQGTPHGGVTFTRGDVPWPVFDGAVNQLYPGWKYKGVDFGELRDLLRDGKGAEVGPGAEYFEGGVDVDERYATRVPGLYAAGEAAVSLFGANRVAAATTEMLVTGAIAGWSAGEHAAAGAGPEPDLRAAAELAGRLAAPLARRGGGRPVELRARLQAETQAKLGPVRTGDELAAYLDFLAGVADELPRLGTASPSRRYNKEWLEALELRNLVQVLAASAQAARARTESRGVHYREDYPHTDNDRWLQEIVVTGPDGRLDLAQRPVTVTSLKPPAGTLPYLEMIRQMMAAHSDVGGHH